MNGINKKTESYMANRFLGKQLLLLVYYLNNNHFKSHPYKFMRKGKEKIASQSRDRK